MFETKISIKSILLFSVPSFAVLLIWIKVVIDEAYAFGIFVSIIAILIFCFSIKKILLTEQELIIRRPLWMFNKDKVYNFQSIQQIKMQFEKTRLGGGPKLIVTENKKSEDYLIYFSSNELKELVYQMEIRNLKIEKDKYFEKQLQ
jgi:hypothetical protein